MTTKLNRSSYTGWQQHGEHHNNEFQNSGRPSTLFKKSTYASILPLSPRLMIPIVLNPERSIKGSLLTSRFCKCYGLVKDSWPSFVFNCSCNFNVNGLHERESDRKWKSFQRKAALKNKKKRNTSCLKQK